MIDWAVHPGFDVLLGDNYFIENSFGFGIAYMPIFFRLIFRLEYHYRFAEKDKRDHVGRTVDSENEDGNDQKIVAETGFVEKWKQRAAATECELK